MSMSVGASSRPVCQFVVTPLIVGEAPVRIVVQFGKLSDGCGTVSDRSLPYARRVFSAGIAERETSSRIPSTMTSTTRARQWSRRAGIERRELRRMVWRRHVRALVVDDLIPRVALRACTHRTAAQTHRHADHKRDPRATRSRLSPIHAPPPSQAPLEVVERRQKPLGRARGASCVPIDQDRCHARQRWRPRCQRSGGRRRARPLRQPRRAERTPVRRCADRACAGRPRPRTPPCRAYSPSPSPSSSELRRRSQFEMMPRRSPRAESRAKRRPHVGVRTPATRIAELVVDAPSDPLGLVVDSEATAQQRVHPDPDLRGLALVGPERVVGAVAVLVVLVDERHERVDRGEVVDVTLLGEDLADDLTHARIREEQRVADVEEDRANHRATSRATRRRPVVAARALVGGTLAAVPTAIDGHDDCQPSADRELGESRPRPSARA